MNFFVDLTKKHRFLYILTISLLATVAIINTSLEFAERVIKNPVLLVFSLVVFVFLVHIAITEEIKK